MANYVINSFLFLLLVYTANCRLLVHTNVGWIQGLAASDGDYSMFMGIPYAYVNASNVFGESIPYPRFDRIFEAFTDSAICPQGDGIFTGQLDCLHLNIYVPQSANTNRLPVMVWIYGGAFTTGRADRAAHGPKFLVRHDVILVTISYRVGAYGFMCLDIPEVPGNQGLKDQFRALTWIKENIYWFGGDPDRVTLFGQSAGGRSAMLHLISNKDKIYQNIITQSGTAFDSGWLLDSNPGIPERIANNLGLEANNVHEALALLSSTDPSLVIGAITELNIQFRPCIEKTFEGVDSFLTDYPVNMDIPKAKDIAILMGANNHEMMASFALMAPETFETVNPFYSRLNAYFDFEDDMLDEIQELVKRFYIGDENISSTVRWNLIDYDSDIFYIHGADRTVRKLIDNEAEKVYYYIFAYSGERNLLKRALNITLGGAAHADDVSYLFDNVMFPGVPTQEDQLVLDRMTTMWTNFAKFGDPTPELTDLLPIKWQPVTKGSPHHYMDIDSSLNLWRKPFNKRMVFWDLLFAGYGQYQKGYRR